MLDLTSWAPCGKTELQVHVGNVVFQLSQRWGTFHWKEGTG